MPNRRFLEILRAARVDPTRFHLDEEKQQKINQWIEQAKRDPMSLVAESVKMLEERDYSKRKCDEAAEAAVKLEQMFQELLDGNRLLCRLDKLRDTPEGPRAICKVNGHLRDLPIHPEVDVDELRELKSWDYVAVNQQVVVGSWREDPYLFANAMGDVVEFKGYKDQELHLVRVVHRSEEKVVLLAPSLWDTPLTPHTKLVLQRDDPYVAISIVPAEVTQSKFEVPVDRIHTRLEDLAGIEDIAQQLIEDILLRIYYPEIRDRFGLDPLKGILLYSYKPGMGKTAFMRAIALWLHEHSNQLGFDVLLYIVKPNECKSMWHGEDARIVREDLWGAIRARQAIHRERPLVQIVVMDEIDSLGKRAGGGDPQFSSAQSDALEAMLVEMDGMIQEQPSDGPPAYVLCAGMTNRPDRVDEAAKRPGRFDLVLPMPGVDEGGAEDIMVKHARGEDLPWYVDGEVQTTVAEEVIRSQFLRPALAQIFPKVILRYKTDTQRAIDVKAGDVLANVHYKDALNRAKKRAALRHLKKAGIPAVVFDDVMDCLVDVAFEAARQMEADPQMLIRQLEVKVTVASIDVIPREELETHRYLHVQPA